MLDLMRRAGRQRRNGGSGADRQRWPEAGDRAAARRAPRGARRAARGPLLPRPQPGVHRRGRGAARRGRQPDGRRAEEGRADRAADGREHRQGHVRRAGRGLDRGRAGEGERGAMRPLAATISSCTSSALRERPAPHPLAELAVRLETRLRRRVPASVLRLPSRPGAGAGAAAERERRGGRGAARGVCESLAREEGLVVGLSDVDRGAVSARRRMREAADAARDRPLAGRRRRRGLATSSSAPTATSSTWSSTRRPAIAIARPVRGAGRVRPPARRPSDRDAGAVPRRPRQRHAPAPGRSTCTRTPSVSGWSGSSASPARPSEARTCSPWSWP